MANARNVAIFLLSGALTVTSVGWYRSSDIVGGDEVRFSSCRWEGSTLVLGYLYGVAELISPSVDSRNGELTVALRTIVDDGPHIAIGLGGEARFGIYDGPKTVKYEDGEELDCARKPPT